MTHHAILVRSSEPSLFSVKTEPSEFVVLQSFEKLTIDDVRALKESAYRRPTEGSVKNCFVVCTSFITVEAQHALLKLLEEPPSCSRFVFVVPPALELLSTVLSRVQIEVVDNDVKPTDEFVEFLEMKLKERSLLIETKIKEKDTAWQERIRTGLISYLKNSQHSHGTTLVDVEFVASNLLTRGASNKMLLDQLALTLPLK